MACFAPRDIGLLFALLKTFYSDLYDEEKIKSIKTKDAFLKFCGLTESLPAAPSDPRPDPDTF